MKIGHVLIGLGLLLIIAPSIISLQTASILFADDFESGNLGSWSYILTTSGENASISTVNPYSGSYHAVCESEGNGLVEVASLETILSPSRSTVSARAYMKFPQTIFDQYDDYVEFISLKSNSKTIATFRLFYTGSNYLWEIVCLNGNSYNYLNTPATLDQTKYYHVELLASLGSSTGTVTAYLDGSQILTATGLNNSAYGDIVNVYFGIVRGAQYSRITVYVDSVIVGTEYIGPSAPVETYTLTVNSQPENGITYTVDGKTAETGTPISLVEGTYTITMPSTVEISGKTYVFSHWEDINSVSPTRTIDLTQDTVLTCVYEESSGSPPPEQNETTAPAYITVCAYNGSTPVNADCYIPELALSFSTGLDGYTVEVSPGTYTIKATYNGVSLEQAVTVGEGQTVKVEFDFANETVSQQNIPTSPGLLPPPTTEEEGLPTSLIVQCAGAGLVITGIVLSRRKEK